MNEYKYRILDNVINLRLANKGAILVEGAKYLRRVADKIDTTKMKNPAFLAVLTATAPFAYKRPDGVFVIPVGCLKD